MGALLKEQLDLFEGQLFPEFVNSEKIRLLEESQNNLRRGLFKRWSEQEKKIDTLFSQVNSLISILSEVESKDEV
jgi:hypothetical protein